MTRQTRCCEVCVPCCVHHQGGLRSARPFPVIQRLEHAVEVIAYRERPPGRWWASRTYDRGEY